jgi:uncharacterized repeat protein (TIGR01451 family)
MTVGYQGASRIRIIFAMGAMLASGGLAGTAEAAGTPAGTNINNVATATFDLPGGGTGSVTSNTVSLTVDELLDVSVASIDPGDVPSTPGATAARLAFRVTNAGNGNEKFTLSAIDTAGGDDFNPSVTSLVLDSNANNAYDAGVDTVYVPGSNDPDLAPDGAVTVFVISSIPAGAGDGQRGRIDLNAVAVTGSGSPGTSFAGQGQGGGNAVVGATGADGTDDGYFVVSAATLSLVKSATVLDPFNGATKVPGSIVTYTLVATAGGSGSLANVQIGDTIPSGTTYRTNTIKLDGNPLTDAADADAGRFGSNAVTVGLGTVAAGGSHTVTFQVSIN